MKCTSPLWLITALLTALSLTLLPGCSGKSDNMKVDVIEFSIDSPRSGHRQPESTPEPQNIPAAGNPDSTMEVQRLDYRRLGRLAEVFNDSNFVHLRDASKIGIEPLSTMHSFWTMRRPLVKIATCPDFVLDKLTHSRPFLVPEGAEMVHEIGRRFRQTVKSRGGGDYRIKVTSVLRTPESVRRLRRVNANALDTSVHQMGTTVDIAYNKFVATEGTRPNNFEQLKGVLAEVLDDMRNEGKIWVKYEIKQPCFHITVREQKK